MSGGPIRVFYNASAVPPRPAGAGVYTIELARALGDVPGLELAVAAPPPLELGAHPIAAQSSVLPRQAWEFTRLHAAMWSAHCDVYHGPHFFTPKTPLPTVATVHDLTFFRLPRRYRARHRWYYSWLARTARRADRVIVPSAAVASDVVRYLGHAPERVRVIAEAPRAGLRPASEADVARFRQQYNLGAPYFVCLGTAEPGKRVVDALRAMPSILARHPQAVLALAGNPGPLSRPLEAEARRLGVADSVKFMGYVPEGELAALLTGAAALFFPSLFEGFGLPPLEAMACGTPVIATDAPAMNEVLGPNALLVPRGDPDALAAAAVRLLEVPSFRAEMSARGLAYAARFSWARAAHETAAVYRELAG